MTDYTICKHKTDGIIILDDNFLSIIAYLEWANSVGVFGKREINSIKEDDEEK